LMVGKHPFEESFGNQQRLMLRHITDPLPRLSEVLDLPAYMAELIRRATAKDPNLRFITVAPMAGEPIGTSRRLVEDRAAGRCAWATAPGEAPVPGRGSVYVAPVAGAPAEAPGRAPSAKVVVARAVEAEAGSDRGGAARTMPVDVEQVRAVTQAAWYAPRGGWEPQAAEAEAEGVTAPLPRQARSGDGGGYGNGPGDGSGRGRGPRDGGEIG